jgi:spore coat protein SA
VKEIAIITSGNLPIPPVRGGAVENLLHNIVVNNEIVGEFRFTIFSVKDKLSFKKSKEYKNTKFIFIDDSSTIYRVGRLFRYILNQLFPNSFANQFLHQILYKNGDLNTYDSIVLANVPLFSKFIRNVTLKPLLLYLHNDYLNLDDNNHLLVLRSVNAVSTISNYLTNKIKLISPDSCQVETVYNGIDLKRFNSNIDLFEKNEMRLKYHILPNEIVIIYAGRIQEHKGVNLLVDSFFRLESKYNIKLLIIGGSEFGYGKVSPFELKLKKMIKKRNSNVIFTGFIDYEEINKIYSIGDFAVLPSLCEEAFGLTVLESIASGLPVIISNAGGMPEIINSKCGIIVQRGPNMLENLIVEMEKLITNPQLRYRMSIEAEKRSLHFSSEKHYRGFSNFLTQFTK